MATKRCLKVDEAGNEWMGPAQFSRALLEDWEISVSVTALQYSMRKGIVPEEHQQKVLGKNAINYTLAVCKYLRNSPRIAPDKLENKIKVFQRQQKVRIAKLLMKASSPEEEAQIEKMAGVTTKPLDEPADDEISQANENAKLAKIKREKEQMSLDIIKGQFIEIDEVAAALSIIGVEFRQSVKAIVPRTYQIFAAETDPHRIREILEEEIEHALDKLNALDEILDTQFDELNQEEADAGE